MTMKIGYYKGMQKGNNVSCFLENHAKQQADKIAFFYLRKGKNCKMTYFQLNEQAAKLALGFFELGIRKGDRVAILLAISPELYLAIAALQRIGAVAVLVDAVSPDSLSAIFENAKPKSVISRKDHDVAIKMLNDSCKTIEFSELLKSPAGLDIAPMNQEESALITYTTGSSGVAKGVNRTHRFLAAQHYALKRLFPYEKYDIDLPVFPVFTLNNIASGITTVLPAIDISKPLRNDEEMLFSQIKKHGVNCMTLAPSSFRKLATYCKDQNVKLSGMRRVLTGGAPISEKDIEMFVEISPDSENYILYGSTEVEPISHIESREMLGLEVSEDLKTSELGVNVGRIDSELDYRLIRIDSNSIESGIDIDTISVGKNEVGELIVTGEHVCREYHENPEAFFKTKIEDKNGRIWHRTGDLSRLDEDGYLWIVGRMHNCIFRDGKYFFPVRPEIILKNIEGVENAAYLSIDVNGKNLIVAVVSCDEAMKISIQKHAAEIFKKQKLPLDKVIFMDTIPMDVRHHSKVEYKLLAKLINEQSS